MKQQQGNKAAGGANGVQGKSSVKAEPATPMDQSFNSQNEDRKPFNQNHGNNQGGNRQNFGGRGRGMGNRNFGGGRGGPGGGNNRNFQQNRNQNQNQDADGGQGDNNQGNRGNNQGDNRGDRMHHKGQNRGMRNGGGEDFMINQKLSHLQGPTHDIPSIEHQEVKFSGRNRLYIGNLTSDITEDELKELFTPYGETSEAFLNAEKFFAFIKVDFRANAEKAKRELDGFVRKSRALRVRFAPNATTIRVKNLTPFVTNELLHKSFEVFGQVERAVIVVDDRGKPTGEGIVEFTRKSGAMAAIRYCTDKCYFLTSSLRPCVCELFEHSDDTDGYPEKTITKKNQDFMSARSCGPRFAEPGSFEHEYGTRWKQLHDLYKQKHDALKNEMKMEEEKLEAQMEYARYEHETEMLRNQLRQREQDRDQRKSNWEMKEKFADEQRMKNEEQMRRAQEEMSMRMSKQEEELRRRQQENTLFMQAQQLNSLLDAQENQQGSGNIGNLGNMGNNLGNNLGGGGGGGGGNNNMRKNFDGPRQNQNFQGGMGGGNMDQFNDFGQNNRNQGGMGGMGGGNRGGGGQRGPWNNQQNDGNFQNKRRRF